MWGWEVPGDAVLAEGALGGACISLHSGREYGTLRRLAFVIFQTENACQIETG
jgi:hypothetical protein